MDDSAPVGEPRPDRPGAPASASWLATPAGQPDHLDELTSDEIRRLLECCALDEIAKGTPDLVYAIGHSSHTAATLISAWGEFRQSTRDAYALWLRCRNGAGSRAPDEQGRHHEAEVAELKFRQADDAWWLITNGLP